jgi:hypothetical protein
MFQRQKGAFVRHLFQTTYEKIVVNKPNEALIKAAMIFLTYSNFV